MELDSSFYRHPVGCQRHPFRVRRILRAQKPCQHMGMAFGAAVHPDFRLFLPIWSFGRNSKREKMFREKEKYDQEVYYKYLFQDVHSAEEITEQKAFIENKGKLSHAEYVTDLAHLHLNSGNWITFNNKIEYFNNGKDKFEALVQDIRNAKEYIHLEYYIWRGDRLALASFG